MPTILMSAFPAGGNLFSSPPPNPRINDPIPPLPPLPSLPPRRSKPLSPKPPPPINPNPKPPNPGLKSHSRYRKPISSLNGGKRELIAGEAGGHAVVLGDSGVSYRLPGAPMEFQFSYSETPKAVPIALREPAFLPFAPPTMPRPWTGKAPLLSKKEKERKRKIRLVEPLNKVEGERVMEVAGRKGVGFRGVYWEDGRSREEILGARLTRAEVNALVKPCLSHNRQVNLGRDGLTHNMLELIHSHWRRQQVCKVRCRGVPTVDMDNICHHLEEKTGGKVILRIGGVVYLFRGRNYSPQTRPRYPIMLWKPAAPVYPKLIQEAPEGLTKTEGDELRKKGERLLPICKLAKNGIYLNLVKDVRDAFEESQLVKINCQGMHASDYKKLGAKLMELVPCILLSFEEEQILMWRGKDWKSRYQKSNPSVTRFHSIDSCASTQLSSCDQSEDLTNRSNMKKEICSPKMLSLWRHAIDSNKALLLEQTELSPDSLLTRVEEFEGVSQVSEHSYPALIVSGTGGSDDIRSRHVDESQTEIDDNSDGVSDDRSDSYEEEFGSDGDDLSDSFEDMESEIAFGSLPLDRIVKRLGQDPGGLRS